MKTMKNVLMILLGAALVLSLAGVGGAAETTTITQGSASQESDLTVTYTIGESYLVTVPVDITLNDETSADFTVNSATLGATSKFVVNITSDNGWNMTFNENKIPYTMSYKIGEEDPVPVSKEGEVTIYETTKSVSSTSPYSMSLLFEIDDPDNLPTVAGDYTDTLTFIVEHTPTT